MHERDLSRSEAHGASLLGEVGPSHPAPLVSVGIPVRNGGAALEEALRSVVEQTHSNLQIIISDNASSDGTEQLCLDLAASDARVEYHRHDPPLTAWRNFAFVAHHARGDYFMWAAHDDTRSNDYIEALLRGLLGQPEAVLAFGDLVRSYPGQEEPVPDYRFETKGASYRRRLKQTILSACAEIYGLHRTEVLAGYPWSDDPDFAPDLPFLVFTSLRGEVVKVKGPRFFQGMPDQPKHALARAQTDSYVDRVKSPRYMRLCWRCARAAVEAEFQRGRRRNRFVAFLFLYGPLRLSLTKTWLFEMSPGFAQVRWRRLKYRGVEPPV